MGWLDRTLARFKRREDALEPESMVQMLHVLVIPSYQAFLNEFPRLREVTVEQYDFVMTNAATTCALMGIESRRPQSYEHARRSAERGLVELWGADGPNAVLDCNGFVNRGLQGLERTNLEEAMSGALGMWIVWNLFRKQPGDGDLPLVSATGRMAFHLSAGYWA